MATTIALSVGAVTVAYRHSESPKTLAAARHQVAVTSSDGASYDTGDPAPKRRDPRPSPDPSPDEPATAAPAAPPAPANPPPPAVVVKSTQQALINGDRGAAALGALTWNDCLYSVAVSNAQRIASQGSLSHTTGPQQDLGCGLGRQAGENIGYWSAGINDPQLNTMFMNSPEHRANIMGPYHYVATAWVVAPNGYGYIAVEFG